METPEKGEKTPRDTQAARKKNGLDGSKRSARRETTDAKALQIHKYRKVKDK
jgi:hypothetical protein